MFLNSSLRPDMNNVAEWDVSVLSFDLHCFILSGLPG